MLLSCFKPVLVAKNGVEISLDTTLNFDLVEVITIVKPGTFDVLVLWPAVIVKHVHDLIFLVLVKLLPTGAWSRLLLLLGIGLGLRLRVLLTMLLLGTGLGLRLRVLNT